LKASQQASKQGRFEADSRQKTRLVFGRRANGSYRVENGVRKAGREGLSCDIGTVMRGSIARRLKYDGLCKFRVYPGRILRFVDLLGWAVMSLTSGPVARVSFALSPIRTRILHGLATLSTVDRIAGARFRLGLVPSEAGCC